MNNTVNNTIKEFADSWDEFISKMKRDFLVNFNSLKISDVINNDDIRFIEITKIIYNQKENNQEKLKAVYSSVYHNGSSLIMLLKREQGRDKFYMGVKSNNVEKSRKTLENSLKGNFLGLEDNGRVKDPAINKLKEDIESKKAIVGLQVIPSNKNEKKDFIQGLEMFSNSIKEDNFIALLIAEPISKTNINKQQNSFEEIYTKLSSLEEISGYHSQTDTEGTSEANTEGTSEAHTEGTSEAHTEGTSDAHTEGTSYAHTKGTSKANTKGTSKGRTKGNTKARTKGTSISDMYGVAQTLTKTIRTNSNIIKSTLQNVLGGSDQSGFSIADAFTHNVTSTNNEGSTKTNTKSKTNTKTKSKTKTNSKSDTKTTSNSDTYTNSQSDTHTTNQSNTQATNQNHTFSTSNNIALAHSLNFKQKNKKIIDTLTLIDENLKRINAGKNQGMWNFSSFFLTDNTETAKICADVMLGLTLGKKQSGYGVHTFELEDICDKNKPTDSDRKQFKQFELVKKSLTNFQIPRIELDDLNIPYSLPVSTEELVYGMPLPEKSIDNTIVMNMIPFGTNIPSNTADNSINIGNISHFGTISENKKVKLNKELLTSHVFVTGSTGSGKSNTIYNLLDSSNLPFLIIEPAKGEYKDIFGNKSDVDVYGANPKKLKLLKINPFKFNDEITITEHIDKLVDIFNSAWDLYAAMPSILKSSIELAYEKKGWRLSDSTFMRPHNNKFPTFYDVLDCLKEEIDNADFGEELRGNYKGALVERVKELTKGFFANMFTNDELDSELLFDKKCIIDISNIGNSRTKSLIMGILFIKLQEYRIYQREKDQISNNAPLKHITVLEEAHHLLPGVSKNKGGDDTSSKSVEIISNAIAEMRTYGECFVIADQSPTKIDSSAIKNTNTKIIHQLPDYEDRKIAGLSAGASQEQLPEIGRLNTGTAMVYQTNWLEPVLCKVKQFSNDDSKYKFKPESNKKDIENKIELLKELLKNNQIDEVDKLLNITNLYKQNKSNYIHKIEEQLYIKHNDFQPKGALSEAIRQIVDAEDNELIKLTYC